MERSAPFLGPPLRRATQKLTNDPHEQILMHMYAVSIILDCAIQCVPATYIWNKKYRAVAATQHVQQVTSITSRTLALSGESVISRLLVLLWAPGGLHVSKEESI